MGPIERTTLVFQGHAADRIPFIPSIYEHGAALLGKTPSEVSRSAELMADAAVAAFEVYEHDLVTVGIDIYNIEAEALGCRVRYHDTGTAIPGVISHPLMEQTTLDAGAVGLPAAGTSDNRLDLVVDACRRVMETIGTDVWVYGCMGGPFSQAVELRGFDNLIGDMVDHPAYVHDLMRKTTAFSVTHAARLSKTGVGVNIYESWATLPLIDPGIFEEFVVPYERAIVESIRKGGYRTPPPAIIMGGNVTELVHFFVETGTALIAADYNVDFARMRRSLTERQSDIVVRGCVDPKLIEAGEWGPVQRAVELLAEKSQGMVRFVWGCGCVTYHTPAPHLLRFKEVCLAQPRGA